MLNREQLQQRRQEGHNASGHAHGSMVNMGGGEGGHVREIELKRSRGEVSCAECRRLKIKCDKKLPCSSCQRRGCASLCPNGSLATGQGTRSVLAATDHLHRRLSKMGERIRQLEDALAMLQSRVSDETHPLLRDELLSLKVRKPEDERERQIGSGSEEFVDAFGTLSISDKGSSMFFGAAGGTERLLMNDDEHPPTSQPSSTAATSPASTRDSASASPSLPSVPPSILRFSASFPFTPMGSTPDKIQALIESHLPPWDRAQILAGVYLENAAWLFRAVSPEQLMEELLPVIYKRTSGTPGQQGQVPVQDELYPANTYSGPHDLALLLMIFSLGALVDLQQEPYNAEAEHYYHLAKAAITLQNVLEKPEMATIQALHLMSIYSAMYQTDVAGHETNMEMSWSLIRLCVQLAETVYRDSARWGLSPKDVQRRRALFWDLYCGEVWQSLSTGRPPSITLPYIDCQFPLDSEAKINEQGQTEEGFGSWFFRFSCDCVAKVAEKTLVAQVPSYATILELDRLVRDFPIPEWPENLPRDTPSMIMIHNVLGHMREVILQSIHRSFFAQALIDDPVNPLRSQYAPSFLSVWRTSAHILKAVNEQYTAIPELSARFWGPWTYAFASAIVFGSVVTRGPSCEMAGAALKQLDDAVELFSSASRISRRAAKALTILQRLQAKAHSAYASVNKAPRTLPPSSDLSDLLRIPDDEGEDELALFGGRTRLVSKRTTPSPSASVVMSPSPEAQTRPHSELLHPSSASYDHERSSMSASPSADWASNTSSADTHADWDTEIQAGYARAYEYAYAQRVDAYEAEQRQQNQHQRQQSQSQPHPPPQQHMAKDQYPWDWTVPLVAIATDSYPSSTPYRPNGTVQHQQPYGIPEANYEIYQPASVSVNSHHTQPAQFPGFDAFYTSGDSGLNQRWTSFMQDTGVFYGNGGEVS
ncbi:hypothetical protein BD410DRAFT_777607 [Rickenella mellea]|uniref:Zn(2)-C6 fungal-type domain-containing protein n=1 Tax=Rickenella mellea TaxID=50990 RepID=A0A4Y7PKF3_9AGAM|nr:hypothetical protein BD410DRAFT_777607 [Rickenella mellea]